MAIPGVEAESTPLAASAKVSEGDRVQKETTAKDSTLRRLARSRGGRIFLAGLTILTGGGVVHEVFPQLTSRIVRPLSEYPELFNEPHLKQVKEQVDKVINKLSSIFSPSKGELFNPDAGRGEISKQNTVPLTLGEAVKLAQEKSQIPDNGLYILLPDVGNNTVNYWIIGLPQGGYFLAFKGLPRGSVLRFPYDAEATCRKERGITTIYLNNIKTPWTQADDNVFMVISGGFSPSFAPSTAGKIKAGDPLLTIETEELVNTLGEPHQLHMGVSCKSKNAKVEEIAQPLPINILPAPQENKAISVTP